MNYPNEFKLSGEILYIDETRPSKEGSTFMLRDFAIEMASMGESNHVKCQLKGTNVDKVGSYLPGDKVVVSFSLLGQCKVKEDKVKCSTNPTGIDGFSPNVNVWKIEFEPGFVRTQQPMNQPKPASNPQPNNAANQSQNSTTTTTTPSSEIDDLPF